MPRVEPNSELGSRVEAKFSLGSRVKLKFSVGSRVERKFRLGSRVEAKFSTGSRVQEASLDCPVNLTAVVAYRYTHLPQGQAGNAQMPQRLGL